MDSTSWIEEEMGMGKRMGTPMGWRIEKQTGKPRGIPTD
jgi:hypothetical protein